MSVDKIIRSGRRSISIEVTKEGSVVLRAPFNASERQIKEVIAKYAGWIQKKKIHLEECRGNVVPKQYIDGEKFLFLGKLYELKIEDEPGFSFRFDGSSFIVDSGKLIYSRQLFEAFYSNSARNIIPPRVYEFAKIIGVDFNGVRITSADTRWGSCSGRRNLNFSWKLIMAPSKVVDYVIVHEIAHLFEMNHSKKFWDIVARLYPSYEESRDWLKTNSHTMIY